MGTVVLLDASRLPAGFLLVAGGSEIEAGASLTCTIMAPPFPMPSAEREVLAARKHVEFAAAVSDEGGSLCVRGEVGAGEILRVLLPGSGLGTWSLSTGSNVLAAGQCERAARK
jgi:hypothetical protein